MKEPLVLLPGMMCDAQLFQPQLAAFSGDRPVMVFPMTSGSISDMARDLLQNAPPSFALAGLSMGGILAMEVIRQAPDRVTRLALMDTSPLAETPEFSANRLTQIEHVRAGGLDAVMRDEMKPNYLVDGPQKSGILSLCMDMAMALGPEVFIAQSRALAARPDQQDTLRGVAVPTLILCGVHDVPCPVPRHELMHALIPHATLTLIENAGHLPVLENPDPTNEALRQWLT